MLQELLTPTSAFACASLALLLTTVLKKRKQLAASPVATASASNFAATADTPVQKDIIGVPRFIATDAGLVPEWTTEDEEPEYEYHIKGLPSAEEMAEWLAEQESVLIRESDQVVTYIEEALNEIRSYPTNPEEVTDRIRQILSSYPIFLDTEYYDSINHFIKQAIQRRFNDINITAEQIAQLWED